MEDKPTSFKETKPVKFKYIKVREPKWDNHPERSETNNTEYRKCLFVIFEDYDGNEFDWMPTWKEVELLNRNKLIIEKINKKLLRNKEESK